MGVDWEDKQKLAFGMLILPDGRIVCQRNKQSILTNLWQATAFRKVPSSYEDESSIFAGMARLLLYSTLRVPRHSVEATHVASHYVDGARLELVMCKMQSISHIIVAESIEIRLVTFDQLLNSIDEDKNSYSPHTIHAANIVSTISSWRT